MSKQTTALLVLVTVGLLALILGAYFVMRSQVALMSYQATAVIGVHSTLEPSANTIEQIRSNVTDYKQIALTQLNSDVFLGKTLSHPNLVTFRPGESENHRIARLRDHLNINDVANAQIITIEAEGNTPGEAADVANAVAETFIAIVVEHSKPTVRITLEIPATPPPLR